MAIGSVSAATISGTPSGTRWMRWTGMVSEALKAPSIPHPGERFEAHSSAMPRRHS
jgi:hypothetical protein